MDSLLKGEFFMFGYGFGYCGGFVYGGGFGYGSSFVLIVVLFILLIRVGASMVF
jgi:uncharacterized protein (TIGR01732 family)